MKSLCHGHGATPNRDVDTAVHKLVTSHLRLVAKIAASYRAYGLPLNDLVSEGSVGLLQAAKRFDPDRGFRLSAYADVVVRGLDPVIHIDLLVVGKIGKNGSAEEAVLQLTTAEAATCRRSTRVSSSQSRW